MTGNELLEKWRALGPMQYGPEGRAIMAQMFKTCIEEWSEYVEAREGGESEIKTTDL